MSRSHQIARLLRAVTELSQDEFAQATGISSHLIAQIESGRMEPGHSRLQKMAGKVGITLSDAEDLLRHLDTLREYRDHLRKGGEEIMPALMEQLGRLLSDAYLRMLALPYPPEAPREADRLGAEELMGRLRDTPQEVRIPLVQVAEDFQTWALCERVCDESIQAAERSIEEATDWAMIAQEIANQVAAPEGLRKRLQGYAGLHVANILREAGDHDRAETAFTEAEKLWDAGSDPKELLDPTKRFELKASLRRDQKRFEEAFTLLEKAVTLSRAPVRFRI